MRKMPIPRFPGVFRRFRSFFMQEEGCAGARKKIWVKKIDFEQIAIMGEGKSRLVPLDPYCNSKGNSVWTYM